MEGVSMAKRKKRASVREVAMWVLGGLALVAVLWEFSLANPSMAEATAAQIQSTRTQYLVTGIVHGVSLVSVYVLWAWPKVISRRRKRHAWELFLVAVAIGIWLAVILPASYATWRRLESSLDDKAPPAVQAPEEGN